MRLLEREPEAGCLRAAIEDAARGRGRAVFVAGGAGLGKSSLLELARDQCREVELRAFSACAEELETTLPWSLAQQLLVPALARESASSRRQLLSGAATPAARVLKARSTSAGAQGGGELLLLVHALFWVIAGIAERSPLALIVDDAHWADEPSARWLAYLARRLADLPIAVIVALRPWTEGPAAHALDQLAGDPATMLVELAPLTPGAATALARETLGADSREELVVGCVRASGGNPFYLQELLRSVRAEPQGTVDAEALVVPVPATVSRSLSLRLSRLRPEAATLARAAAVLGDRAALSHGAELAGLDLRVAACALDELAGAELLRPAEPMRFIHPLVASSIHEDLPPAQRADWHLKAARILDRHGVEPSRLAPHLLMAGARGDQWVVQRLRSAAAAAVAQDGLAAAATYLTRALDEPPPAEVRADLLAELGRLESALGRSTAPGRLRASLELTPNGESRGRLLFELGRALVVAGEHGQAARAFESGLRELERPDSELARELRAAWWMAASADPAERSRVMAAGDPDVGEEQAALTLGQRQLLAQLAQERAFAGHPPNELVALAQRAWGDGALLAGETSDGLSWSLVTGALLAADALELELELCDAVIADARRRGSPMAYATASYCRAWPLLHTGQVGAAIVDAQAAISASRDGWATFLPMAAACLAIAQLEHGAVDDAAAALALAEATPDLERSNQYPMVLIARGRLQAAQRQFEAAAATQLRAGELLTAVGFDNPALFPWRTEAALAAAFAGQLDEARALATAAHAAADRSKVPITVARALRAIAVVSDGVQAIDHLRRALALTGRQRRLERLHLLTDLGSALRRANQRTDAIAALREAHALAVAGGANAIADRARTELGAAGVRLRREPTRGTSDSLTPSELRVAELAAAGHSNRDIAQLLFVTTKTVEYHLSSTYRKLGVNRRSQVGAALAAQE